MTTTDTATTDTDTIATGIANLDWHPATAEDVATVLAWESIPRDYAGAQVAREQALIDSARDFLELEPVQYDGGAWVDYV